MTRQPTRYPTQVDRQAAEATATRVRRNFWTLVAAGVVAVGVMSLALSRPASPATGATVALSGIAALACVTLAARIMVVTSQLGRRSGVRDGKRHR